MAVALELAGIGKSYGALAANEDVALAVAPGEIHALCGENGAGKTTLLKIAYGEVRADAGRIVLGGEAIAREAHSPARAIARGLGMVHQHFMLVGPLTVVENVVIGREPRRGAFLDLARAAAEIRAVSERLGLGVDPARRVGELSVGEQQRVEIVKVLWRGAEVLLLDEPTAVLTPPEVADLFRVLRTLSGEGKAIVLCTHKLDEVTAVADRVTVMRRGRVVAELSRGETTAEAIARAMVGRELAAEAPFRPATHGEVAFAVEGLRVARRGAADAVRGVSLEVRAGEILGIAGVEGNGQSELALALAGLQPAAAGTVRLAGRDVTRARPAARAAAGLAHVPEDRHRRGLVLDFTVAENLILGRQRELAGRFGLSRARVAAHARALIERFDVRPADPAAVAATLSGGNQQKVVIARELSRPGLKVLLAAQPTRGVDAGASERIRAQILAARDAGAAVLLVSSDLAELRALCDRIAVMYRGELAATLPRGEATDEALGALMTGARIGRAA